MPNESAKVGLRLMALLEGAKGALVLGVGLGLFALVHRDVQAMAEDLVRHFHLNPARRFPQIFLQMAANLTDRSLWVLAAAATAYSLMRFVEAYGLWRGWHWMKWFAVISGGVYLPIEIHSISLHFALAKLIVLGLNTLVVAYLFFHLASEGRQRAPQPKPRGVLTSNMGAFLLLLE